MADAGRRRSLICVGIRKSYCFDHESIWCDRPEWGIYRGFEWWANRDRTNVERALEHTPLAVGLREAGGLVAAARVLAGFISVGYFSAVRRRSLSVD